MFCIDRQLVGLIDFSVLFCMYKQLPVKLEYVLYFQIIGRVQFILNL